MWYLVAIGPDGDLVRLDIYDGNGSHQREAVGCDSTLVVGCGSSLYLVDVATAAVTALDLEDYFVQLKLVDRSIIVATARRLHCITLAGSPVWKTEMIGLDGVLVESDADGVIAGSGEWDPPGGWRPFKVSLSTGQLLDES